LILRARVALLTVSTGAVIALGFLWARTSTRRQEFPAPRLVLQPSRILANGYSVAELAIESRANGAPKVNVSGATHSVVVEQIARSGDRWMARVRAGVLPGRARFDVSFPDSPPASVDLETQLDTEDSLEDGTPDCLRLDSEHDREAFRRWFTFLAEAQYVQQPASRPVEINDCAALIRYAYREALRSHVGGWAAEARLPVVQAFESVSKYEYPHTPLGPSLFRVRQGGFRATDLDDGAFAQFADAKTLWRLNCHFVSRGVAAALPGDLLFFRQGSRGEETFHSMIYLGESRITKDGKRYLLYHTGPADGGPGELRKLSVDELLRFPQSEWRPLAGNPGFLGVYRWNILCSGVTR
jgi:uncharacterized protein YfaT (DUF1175 family)